MSLKGTKKPAGNPLLKKKAGIILDGLRDAALVVDQQSGNVVYANRAAGTILGTDPAAIAGSACDAILSRASDVCGMIRPDGSRIPVLITTIPFAARGRTYAAVICSDQSDQLASEMELLAANEKLKGWFVEAEQRNHEVTLLQELSNLLQHCRTLEDAANIAASHMARIVPRSSGQLVLSDEGSGNTTISVWGGHSASGTGLEERILLEYHGESFGTLHVRFGRPAEMFPGAPEETVPAHLRKLVGSTACQLSLSIANIRMKGSLLRQAMRDPLTGLYNRRYLEETIAREVARAQRTRKPLGIIMADIDHFKIFNDRFGHAAGDEVLKTVSSCLQSSVRTSDIVCRYGGEEFIAVLPDASLANTAMRAEQIRIQVASIPMIFEGKSLGRVTLSLGVAEYPGNGQLPESFLKEADKALYRAKKEGRNRVSAADAHADAVLVDLPSNA